MAKGFAAFKLANTLDDIKIKIPFGKLLSDSYIEKTKLKKILLKVPIEISEINIAGIEGYEVQIPITASILKEKDENYIRTIIDDSINQMIDEECHSFVFPEEIMPYVEDKEIVISNGKGLQFLLLDKVIEKCINLSEKKLKELNFVIIDGQDSLSDFCIDYLYDKVNYLTIVTKRPVYFEETKEFIFEETGLAVEVLEDPLNNYIESDIVINCRKEKNKAFYFYNKKAFLIDFVSDKSEIKNVLLKRKDLQVVDDISLKINKIEYDTKLLQAAIFSQNRIFRSWLMYGYKKDMIDRIEKVLSQFNLEVKDLYQYGKKIIF
ncbi:hypothetical protein EDC18_105153 [Natranaerovirga pectinivora]|uniref:Uncharacterized protein n=1 Tax=Natranaerovirga pectinivora TaxID=682400 RepID=A0A4R3MKC3_9FIRM|nr:hypothetical protein [Natranaerovirga pectinivora]TCT14671.1 hypothetical protein EDC18_105153 [Natranaerovirga pectinivora]